MPYCPNCGYEYDKGFTHCSDCGTQLVGALPPTSQEYGPEPRPETKKTFLIKTKDDDESNKVVNLLNRNAIPAYVQDDETGAYSDFPFGFSEHGNSMYVEEDEYEEAAEIINEVFPDAQDPKTAAALEQEVREKAAKIRKWAGIGLILFGSIYLLWYFFR